MRVLGNLPVLKVSHQVRKFLRDRGAVSRPLGIRARRRRRVRRITTENMKFVGHVRRGVWGGPKGPFLRCSRG